MGQIARSTERIFSFVNVCIYSYSVHVYRYASAHRYYAVNDINKPKDPERARGAAAVSMSRFALRGNVDLKINIYFTRMSICSLLPLRVIFQPNSQDYYRNRSCEVLYST